VRRVGIAVGLASLALAGVAWAEAGEHGAAHSTSEGWWVLARHALNLIALGWVLVRFALPALRDFMRQRSEALRERIDGAKLQLAAAQQELAQLRAQLGSADSEAQDLIEQAERAARAEQERSLERARESAERLREDARRIADQELERARAVLRAEAAQLATEAATRLLQERIDANDDRRLFDEFAQRMGSAS